MSERIEARSRRVLEAALALAVEKGFRKYNRRQVAERAGVACGTVSHAFGSMDELNAAVMGLAAAAPDAPGHLAILGQGVVDKHPGADGLPVGVQMAALASLAA